MGKRLTPEEAEKALAILGKMEAHRFFWKASGYIDQDLERPVIAIANSMQDAGVGHAHLRELARHVKESVYAAGGTPIEFNVIAPCAGYSRSRGLDDITMLYDLPQRDNIADALGLNDVAVITDSRFSGATEGALYVGYIAPEAYVGGPLAAVRDGDEISISVRERRVDVKLSDEEIGVRLQDFTPPEPRVTTGVLVDWNRTATQFHEGAMLKRTLK